jgi:hypothetical protein
MADPIAKLGVKAITPQTVETPGVSTGKKFTVSQPPSEAPEAKATPPVDKVQMQQDLRHRIEKTGTQNPSLLFGQDFAELGGKLKALDAKRVPPTVRAELEKVEARFQASQAKLDKIPEANNLRDLLKMQTELYEMSQSVEMLSKVIDTATSGVKQTLQMQV